MFQQTRALHGMDSMDFLVHQKMSERMLSVSQQQQQQPPPLNLESGGNQSTGGSSKRSRVDQPVPTYDHTPAVNFYPMVDPASSVVLTRCEYDAMRQEVVNLKRALADFRNSVDSEIETLKKENKLLRRQVSRCTCGCRVRCGPVAHQQHGSTATDKLSEDENDVSGMHYDKSVDDGDDGDVSSVTARGIVDMLERDNKSLLQRSRELEKQLHILRAAGSRMPPIPSLEAVSFLRELVAYYTLLESSSAMSLAAASEPPKDSYISLLSLDTHNDRASSVAGASGYCMPLESHSFTNGLGTPCSLYGTMPEAFDVEKGLQVQLIPNYNVWVSKSKLQFIMKEALAQKDGAPLFVLRRLIPLVFTWEELAASRGQGLNCKSTEDVMNKDPLDPTKVLVCKAYMRKFCMETGHVEPLEKAVNETFSHQVNYARRKFKQRIPKSVDGTVVANNITAALGEPNHDDSFSQSQCPDNQPM